MTDILSRLSATIAARKSADPASSWTAQLLARGPEKCAEKFGEEAVEAIIEAVRGDRARLLARLEPEARDVDPEAVVARRDPEGLPERRRRVRGPP